MLKTKWKIHYYKYKKKINEMLILAYAAFNFPEE